MNLREHLCHHGPDKSNGQKNDEQYQNTNFSSFWKKKERLRHSAFFMWLRRLQPNFEEMHDDSRKHREKVKKHVYIFYLHANIIYYNSNNSNALT